MEQDIANNHSIDYQKRTYAQSCTTLLPDASHLEKLQDAVFRMNRIKMLAGELLARHILRCMDPEECEKPALPDFTQTWCRQLFKEVSVVENPKKIEGDDPELKRTMELLEVEMPFQKPSRSGLTQMLSAEATVLRTTIKTNIARHFKKRVLSFVRWTFTDDAYSMLPQEYTSHKLAMMQIVEDLCRTKDTSLQSPNEFHNWVEQYRMLFGLDSLLETDTLNEALEATPERFLPCMKSMNQVREGSGWHTFALLPLTRKFRPGFVVLDIATWQQVLGMPIPDTRKAQCKASLKKRTEERANGIYVTPKDINAKKKLARQQEIEERKLTKRKREAEYTAANESKDAQKQRKLQEKQARDEKARQLRIAQQAKKDCVIAEKDDYFAQFLNIRINPKKGFHFSHSIRTDGISARLLFTKTIRASKAVSVRGTVKRGLYAIDTLKHLSRLEDLEVIGVDPGMHDLIHAAGENYLNDPSKRLRYSSAQRRNDRCSNIYAKKMNMEKGEVIVSLEQQLSAYNSRSNYPMHLKEYFELRRANMETFYNFYGIHKYRIRRWRTFQKDQKSVATLINSLKAMGTKGKTTVIAYGAWANASSTFNPKSIAPCIGKGLRRRIATELVVADTPEHYTSKTCSKCFHECGAFRELELQRRKEAKSHAKTPEEEKRASRLTIRSIRRCQNEKCGVILNRDRNAASNIATNFKLLFQGQSPLRKQIATEQQLEKLKCSICNA